MGFLFFSFLRDMFSSLSYVCLCGTIVLEIVQALTFSALLVKSVAVLFFSVVFSTSCALSFFFFSHYD